jgi:hypothetical protein
MVFKGFTSFAAPFIHNICFKCQKTTTSQNEENDFSRKIKHIKVYKLLASD